MCNPIDCIKKLQLLSCNGLQYVNNLPSTGYNADDGSLNTELKIPHMLKVLHGT